MKKLSVITLLCLVLSVAAHAQDFRKFRVGLGVGYAGASGEGAKGGILVTLEPGYRISDQILANLRIESAAMVRGAADPVGDVDLDVAAIGSYTVNGQYYFNNNGFRPFVGLGLGLYSLAAISYEVSGGSGSGDATAAESKFGFYPRVGFDAGHFTLSFDYNIIPPTDGIGGSEFKNSYFGIRIGGFFGGGRK